MEFRSTLTPLQQGMLIHSIDRSNRSCYVVQTVFAWKETIQAEVFKAAWQELARRHEVLRSRFQWKNIAEPQQLAMAEMAVDFEIRRDVPLDAWLEQDLERGFALSEASPWRVTLLTAAEGPSTAVWTFHHLLLDGRSHVLLLRELLEVYDGLLHGVLPPVVKPEVPHRLQADWLAAQDFSYAESYWTGYLENAPTGVEFPKPLDSQPGAEGRYRSYDSSLGRELTAQLKAFSASSKISIGNIIQAGWAFVLGWLANRNDVVIGAVRAARKSGVANGEDLIGMMINTVPLRVRWERGSTVRQVLETVARDWRGMRSYEQTPLPFIQSWLKLGSGKDLFTSVLSYSAPHFLDGVFHEREGREQRHIWVRQTTPYCSMDASLDRDDLTLSLNLPEALVEPSLAARLPEYLSNTVRAVITAPDAQVSAIAALSGAERGVLLRELNTRWEPAPRSIDWIERIWTHARERPEEMALSGGGQSLSWRQLNSQANQVAAFLSAQGAGTGLVAVFLPRSSEFVWTCLGILQAGAAYLPLDVKWPSQRVAAVLEDAHPSAILTMDDLEAALPKVPVPLWTLRACTAERFPLLPVSPLSPEQLAYVIYTSGSSGTPKGVEVLQRGLQNLIEDAIETFSLSPADRGCFVSNTAFDASVHEVWPLLAAGASVHLPDAAVLPDPAALLRWMAEQRISFAFVSVMVAEAMTLLARDRPTSLRYLLTGGDQLRRGVEGSSFELINEYGPTEYTVVATRFPVRRVFDGAGGIPIGKPLRGTRAYVMNQWQQLLPRGVAGELVLAGHGAARGYRNRIELTAEKFVPNPLAEEPERTLYRTGDLVRWLPSGDLQFLGRIDSQVKLRGFRIELGEIEANLLRHPEVAEAVVLLLNEPAPRLAAFVVPVAGATGDSKLETELSGFLRGVLAEYMIPGQFVFEQHLPVNSSGKYDRKELARLAARLGDRREAVGANARVFGSERESEMAALWQEVLSVPRVEPEDRFLSLGGTSLSIIRLICAIDQKFGAEVPAAELFRDPTPGELVRLMEGSVAEPASALVRMNSSRKGRLGEQATDSPLFLIPGAGGGIHWFRDLAEAIDPRRPIFGIELLALSETTRQDFTVDRAVGEILELIRRQAAGREYTFCGYSGGGLLALECARRFTGEGVTVKAVVLLDTYLPPAANGKLAQTARWLRGWWALPAERRWQTLRGRFHWFRQHQKETVAAQTPAQLTVALQKQAHIDAFMRHQVAPYAGAVQLFFAEERPLSVDFSAYDNWRGFMPQARIAFLPGSHYDLLLSDNAGRLAGYFNGLGQRLEGNQTPVMADLSRNVYIAPKA